MTDSQWLAAGDHYYGPLDGQPSSGDATIGETGPVVPLVLGVIDGQELTVDVSSVEWLDLADAAVRIARTRLLLLSPLPPGRAA